MNLFNTNPQHWIQLKNLFNLHPLTINLGWSKVLIAFAALMILSTIIIRLVVWRKNSLIASRARKKFYVRISSGLFYFGLALAVLIGSMLERIYLFSARFWFIIWALSFITWLIFLIRYRLKVVPQIEARLAEKQLFSKYLLPQRRKT